LHQFQFNFYYFVYLFNY